MTTTKTLGALAAALLLSACAVGPRYEAPKTEPAAFTPAAAQPSFSSQPFEAAWWTAFEDPTLDELERRALAGNLDLRVAVARVREARALFRDARLDQFPRVTASAGYSDGRTPQPGGPPLTDSTWQAGFDAGWEIDLFGRVRHAVDAARAEVGAAEADLHDAQVLVAAEVARTYFEYLGARDRLAVARRNLATQRDTVRLTKTRFEVGLGDAVGVASAQAALANTEASIPTFTIQATQAAHRLAVLVGERPGALDALLAPERPRRVLAKALPIGDASALLRRRPDVAAAERRLAAQTARVGVATADLFPRVSVTGFVGFLSGDLSSLGGDASRMWSVAPAISWPALDLGGAQARLRAQQARGDAALAGYEQTVLLALEDVQNAIVAYAQTQERVASLARRSGASRRAAELARVRYREGAVDFLTLLDAERTLLDAEDAESAAQTALNTQVVALYKALGGGWDTQGATQIAAR
jgi:outer membrane protein, multidrug efflux system